MKAVPQQCAVRYHQDEDAARQRHVRQRGLHVAAVRVIVGVVLVPAPNL